MLRKIALTAATAAVLAASALAAPAAHASTSTSAGIQQPDCWNRTVKCLVAAPATPPPLKYQPATPPPLKYQPAEPGLKYQDQPGQDPPPVHYHA